MLGAYWTKARSSRWQVCTLALVVATFTTTACGTKSEPSSISAISSAGAGTPNVRVWPDRPLNLVVMVVHAGYAVRASLPADGPGCATSGGGVTIPLQDGAYDFASLGRCAAE